MTVDLSLTITVIKQVLESMFEIQRGHLPEMTAYRYMFRSRASASAYARTNPKHPNSLEHLMCVHTPANELVRTEAHYLVFSKLRSASKNLEKVACPDRRLLAEVYWVVFDDTLSEVREVHVLMERECECECKRWFTRICK